MDFLLEALTNWLKEMLVGGIMSNLSGMFDSVNQQVADISVQVGQTPRGWNGSIFNMIENLSNSIMVPIAGVILAIVMTIDLIQMIADKNNLHDVDTWMIFKWVFKSAAAILIVTNTWNIVMGVFDMAQAAGIINSDASIDLCIFFKRNKDKGTDEQHIRVKQPWQNIKCTDCFTQAGSR